MIPLWLLIFLLLLIIVKILWRILSWNRSKINEINKICLRVPLIVKSVKYNKEIDVQIISDEVSQHYPGKYHLKIVIFAFNQNDLNKDVVLELWNDVLSKTPERDSLSNFDNNLTLQFEWGMTLVDIVHILEKNGFEVKSSII